MREPVLGVDPTSPLRLRLEPLDDAAIGDGETGSPRRVPFAFARCRGTVPGNETVPGGRATDRSPTVRELLVSSASDTFSDTSSSDNLIRLAVTCEPACATHGALSGPAPDPRRRPCVARRRQRVPLPRRGERLRSHREGTGGRRRRFFFRVQTRAELAVSSSSRPVGRR